jgi:hypothetical protein
MKTLYLILYLLAAVCFLVAAFHPFAGRQRLTAGQPPVVYWWAPVLVPLGLLLWVLVPLIQTIRTL